MLVKLILITCWLNLLLRLKSADHAQSGSRSLQPVRSSCALRALAIATCAKHPRTLSSRLVAAHFGHNSDHKPVNHAGEGFARAFRRVSSSRSLSLGLTIAREQVHRQQNSSVVAEGARGAAGPRPATNDPRTKTPR